jgi:hypothetical protein
MTLRQGNLDGMSDYAPQFFILPQMQRIHELCQLVLNAHADPLERLRASNDLRRVLRTADDLLVDDARTRFNATWEDIGAILEITKQAAHERFAGD